MQDVVVPESNEEKIIEAESFASFSGQLAQALSPAQGYKQNGKSLLNPNANMFRAWVYRPVQEA